MAGERTLPGISLTGYWDAGDNTWKPANDENLRKLSLLVQLRVLSRVVWPGFEDSNSSGVANGDIYIVPTTDSNSQQDSNSAPLHNYIAVHDNGSWVYYAPLEGFHAYVIDEDQDYVYKNGSWQLSGGAATAISYDSGTTGDSNSTQTTVAAALDDLYARIRDISIGAVDATTVTYAHDVDSNSQEVSVAEALDELFLRPYDIGLRLRGTEVGQVVNYLAVRPFYIPADFADSRAYCATTDTTARTFNVYKNGSLIGAFTFAISTATATFDAAIDSNSGTEFTFAPGDRLGIEVPAVLGTMLDISITFLAYRIN